MGDFGELGERDVALYRAVLGAPNQPVPEFAVALLVGVAVGVLAAIPFLQNHTFYYVGDNPESFLPLWHHLGEQLRSGRWPTMDPGGWTGGNSAAEASYALWNPVLLLDHVGYRAAAGHLRECLAAAAPASTTEEFTETVLDALGRKLKGS